MTKIDYNIDNYSESELFKLFGVDSNYTAIENLEKVDQFMKDFIKRKKDENIQDFLQVAASKILSIYVTQANSSSIRELTTLFQQNNQTIFLENIKQHASYVIHTKEGYVKLYLEKVFQILTEKISQRQYEIVHKTEAEFTEQFVYLDTRFRNNLSQSSNNSIFDIPETKQVVSLGLHNIEVPLTWKIFDETRQNNFILIGTKNDKQLCGYKCKPVNYDKYDKISINDDNLNDSSGSALLDIIIRELKLNSNGKHKLDLSYNNYNNRVQIMNSSDKKIHIVFHDSFSEKFSKVNMNQTLGWKLGFRVSDVVLSTNSDSLESQISAQTYVNMYSNSLYLQVDDFVTHSSEAPVILPVPKYTMKNSDLTYCLQKKINTLSGEDLTNVVEFIEDNKDTSHDNPVFQKKIQNLLQTIGKTPDVAKLLLDDIQTSIQNKNIQRIREPFAVIDLRGSPIDSIQSGKYLSEYHEDFMFKKSYVGPTSISKIKINIYDEQGELIDFQGCDFKLQMKLVKRRQPKSAKINLADL
jgi:hypothetical protein